MSGGLSVPVCNRTGIVNVARHGKDVGEERLRELVPLSGLSQRLVAALSATSAP
jgi:hypothetical protein